MAVYSFFLTDGFGHGCNSVCSSWSRSSAFWPSIPYLPHGARADYSHSVAPSAIINATKSTQPPWRYISMFFLCPLALPLYERWYRPHLLKLRVAPKGCAHCHNTLQRVPYEQAHTLLSQRQKAEEEHRFADYDVWSCPHCQHTEVLSYTPLNKNHASLSTCDQCAMSQRVSCCAPAPLGSAPQKSLVKRKRFINA